MFCPSVDWVAHFDALKHHELFVDSETNPSLVTPFENIFSQSVSCLFALLLLALLLLCYMTLIAKQDTPFVQLSITLPVPQSFLIKFSEYLHI